MKASNVFYNRGFNLFCNQPNKEWLINGFLGKGEVGFVDWNADYINYCEDEMLATVAVAVSQGAWWCGHRAHTAKVLVLNHNNGHINHNLAMAMTKTYVYMPDNLFVANEEPVKGQFITREEVLDFCLKNGIELVIIDDKMKLASVWSGLGAVPKDNNVPFDLSVLKPFTDNNITILMSVSYYDNHFKALPEPKVFFKCTKYELEEGVGAVSTYEVSAINRNVENLIYIVNQNDTSVEAQSFRLFHHYEDIDDDYHVTSKDEEEDENE